MPNLFVILAIVTDRADFRYRMCDFRHRMCDFRYRTVMCDILMDFLNVRYISIF